MTSATGRTEEATNLLNSSLALSAAWLLLVGASAFIAGAAPVWFAMTIVIIFGAPHNYVEFRYFISRLPSKFTPFKAFFLTAIGGVLFLAAAQSMVMFAIHSQLFPVSQAKELLFIWNELLISWTGVLFLLRYRRPPQEAIVLGFLTAIILSAANYQSPPTFTSMLAYAHPLAGLAILEREIRRTAKSWLKLYHLGVLMIPAAVALLIFALKDAEMSASYAETLIKVSGNSAYKLFADVSPKALLAVYAFLQMIHYGIWIFIMPIVTKAWKRWSLANIPVLQKRETMRPPAHRLIYFAAVTVFAFWLGFVLNRAATLEFYVMLATIHVLAEIPFLFWMFES